MPRVKKPNGEIVEISSAELEAMIQPKAEKASWWQFSPDDTLDQALNKFGAAGLKAVPYGDEIAAWADVQGGLVPKQYQEQQRANYDLLGDQASNESFSKALLAQVLTGGVIGSPLSGVATKSPYLTSTILGALEGSGEDESNRLRGALIGGVTSPLFTGAIKGASNSVASVGKSIADSDLGLRISNFLTPTQGQTPLLDQAEKTIAKELYSRDADLISALKNQERARSPNFC